MICPVKNPVVTSPYGDRVLNGAAEFHPGVDYISNRNANVYAMDDGEVTTDKDNYDEAKRWLKDTSDSLGNVVIIRHGDYYVRYCHLISNYVSCGEKVKQGQLIGIYGNVGFSFGAHIHVDAWTVPDWKNVDISQLIEE